MRDENLKKNKLSWSKSLVKKWFNIKSKAEDFHADDVVYGGGDEDWRSRFTEMEAPTIKKTKTERVSKRNSDRVRRGKIEPDATQVTDVQNYSIFVATWNVGGKSPPSNLNLEDWLHTSSPADIYVLGFQEIVPLNAGNVLGSEDNGPARKWLSLIRKTLNNLPGTSGSGGCYTPSPIPDPIVESDFDFEGSTRQKALYFFRCQAFQSLSRSLRDYGHATTTYCRLGLLILPLPPVVASATGYCLCHLLLLLLLPVASAYYFFCYRLLLQSPIAANANPTTTLISLFP